MIKWIALPFVLLQCAIGFAQTNTKQQVEVYAMPQLFTAQLSNDSLVPSKRRGSVRLGDEAVFGLQYGRMLGRHILLKAGVGFSTREYSLTKYSVGDIIGELFLFDSPPRSDSFPIARMQYKLNYFEIPLTISYEKANRHAAVQFHYGLMARLQFLNQRKATITFDSTSSIATFPDVSEAEKSYADDVKSFVISVQPYGDLSFRLYKGLNVSLRFSPFSFYASSLNNRVSTSQAEMLGCGVALSYRF